jgi:hypothetical protein
LALKQEDRPQVRDPPVRKLTEASLAEAAEVNKAARKRLDPDADEKYPDIRSKAGSLFDGLDLNVLSDAQFQELGDKLVAVV